MYHSIQIAYDLFFYFNQKIAELLNMHGIFMGKLKTAKKHLPFVKWDTIGLFALNFKIIRFKCEIILDYRFLSPLKIKLPTLPIVALALPGRFGERQHMEPT